VNGRLEPFALGDLEQLEVQPKHAWLIPIMAAHPLNVAKVAVGPWSWTYWLEMGVPIFSAGIMPNGYSWALFGYDMRRHMIPAVSAIRTALQAHKGSVGTVFAEIDSNYIAAVRLAKALGFVQATPRVWEY
jgi:hypothetical protein